MKILNIKDNEVIRMALNQIHYLSIQEARAEKERKEGKKSNYEGKINNPSMFERIEYGDTTRRQVVAEFLRSQEHLIEPGVFKAAMDGDDKSVSLALGIIHHKTLVQCNWVKDHYKNGKVGSYKAALLSQSEQIKKNGQNTGTPTRKGNNTNIVLFTGFGEEVQVKDIWKHCKEKTKVKDIILPRRRRDRNNRRYGFIVTENG